jgi:acetylornithine/N-succinyldiaminopimelate aminotransferase
VSKLLETHLLPTYARAPVTFVEGDGCWLIDDNGERYLDFAGGIAVIGLGHRHPASTRAAHEQLDRLWHVSNLYWTVPMMELAKKLSERFGGAQAFFCNSGAEAVETAIKYARRATGKAGIVALEDSFHGRTMGGLSITGQPAKRERFAPLLGQVSFAFPNNSLSLRAAALADTGLIIMEPIQGEGGVRPIDLEFAQAARSLADELGALLCFDEVQTGVGRTGSFFGFESLGARPDLVTLAKGLANGLPIGALLVADGAARGFEPGEHASTFGGNPVACAAACAVLDAIDEDLLANVRATGERLTAGLRELPGVSEVRGAGLLIGADVEGSASDIVAKALEHRLLVTTCGPSSIRLTPPLTVSAGLVDQALATLREVLA